METSRRGFLIGFVSAALLGSNTGAQQNKTPAQQSAAKKQTQQPMPAKKIEIIGSNNFKQEITKALELIKQVSPQDYKMVTDNIQIIRYVKNHSNHGVLPQLQKPTFDVSDKDISHCTMWTASIIIHDAYHSKLYNEYKQLNPNKPVPDAVWMGEKAEKQCMDVQKNFLIKAKAPKNLIDYIDKVSNDIFNPQYWTSKQLASMKKIEQEQRQR